MEEQPDQPDEQNNVPKRSLKTYGLIALIVAVCVVAAGFAAYKLTHKPYTTKNYQTFSTYSVKGKSNNAGISFQTPTGFKQISKSDTDLEMYQTWSTSSASGITYIAATTEVNNPPLEQAVIDDFGQEFKAPNDKKYSTAIAPITDFIQRRLTGWKINLSPAKDFTNPSIGSGAWSFGFSATYQQDSIDGRLIYAITKNNTYSFLVYSNTHNWQANIAAWQKILNSLKVDQ